MLTKKTPETPGPENPHPLDRAGLKAAEVARRRELGRVRRQSSGALPRLLARVQVLLARFNSFRLMRVWQLYNLRHGPLMAAGVAFNQFFAVTSLLVVGFSVFGLILADNRPLLNSLIAVVADSVPGLIDVGDGRGGLAKPEDLLQPQGLALATVIASATMLISSLNWIAGVREGFRGIFDLPALKANPLLMKARDLGTLLALTLTLVITSGVTLVSFAMMDLFVQLLRLDADAVEPAARLVTLAVTLAMDTVTAVILFHWAAGIRLPRRVLLQAALVAAVGSSGLRILSAVLLAGAGKNPLLAPFAVIIGLLLWFNFLSQVYLLAASWAAVGRADDSAGGTGGGNAGRTVSLRQRSRAGRAT